MSDLYQLEHKIIPMMLFPDKDGKTMSPFWLGNHFSGFCMNALRHVNGIEDENEDIGYDPDTFVAEPFTIKDNGEPAYYITRLRFPFMENMYSSTLCPRTYLVHGLEGENLHYYTIEYDQTDFKGPGSYWLCGWVPNKAGKLNHANMGPIHLDEQGELRRLIDMNNKYFGIE